MFGRKYRINRKTNPKELSEMNLHELEKMEGLSAMMASACRFADDTLGQASWLVVGNECRERIRQKRMNSDD